MVEIKNYCKSIKSRPILNNVSYNFEYGKIYGIYGHNGSGKTMLLRAIAGLLVPDSGSVVIDGKVLHKDMSFPPSIGIVIENMNLLPQYNAFDNLKILGKIKKTATDEDIKTALERVGLKSDLKVKKFSLGMKQRLNIAQAVFEKQKIILLCSRWICYGNQLVDTAFHRLSYPGKDSGTQKGCEVSFQGLQVIKSQNHDLRNYSESCGIYSTDGKCLSDLIA